MKQTRSEWTVLSMLEWATGYFEEQKVPSPRRSIEWLLSDLLGVKRLDLYLMYDRPLSPDELTRLRPMVRRRASHEPLQYITGETDFLGCRILVDSTVLIPRQETEQLVELLLERESDRTAEPLSVIDLGTGSGCIPIAIKRARPDWSCTGLDVSAEALRKAAENAEINQVDVTWIEGDLNRLQAVDALMSERFDLIISNPPYIFPEEKQTMEAEVYSFEPEQALFHPNPFTLYDSIVSFAAAHLSEKGCLYLECNTQIIDELKERLCNRFRNVSIALDLDSKERFLIAQK